MVKESYRSFLSYLWIYSILMKCRFNTIRCASLELHCTLQVPLKHLIPVSEIFAQQKEQWPVRKYSLHLKEFTSKHVSHVHSVFQLAC